MSIQVPKATRMKHSDLLFSSYYGVESSSKLCDSIYFEESGKDPGLYIIQYLSNSVNWKLGQIVFEGDARWDQEYIEEGDEGRHLRNGTKSHIALDAAVVELVDQGQWDPITLLDDLTNAFSTLLRDINFIDHTSDIDWKSKILYI